MARKPKIIDARIDPEFERLIDPLTDEEYAQLKENIREYGLLDKIKTWLVWKTDSDGRSLSSYHIIIDGHNRHKIINELAVEEPGNWSPYDPDDYESVDGVFNREQAKEYIIKNQLGRRNLTREQKLRYIGQLQKNRKQSHGGQVRGMGQNEPSVRSTAEAIAKEFGVSESTVKRAEKFSSGIDALETVSKEAAEKVLKGKANVSVTDVASFPKMKPEEQEDFIELVVNPEKKKARAKEPESFIDAVFSEVERRSIPDDTIHISVPMSKKLFNTVKEIAALTGESPDELIVRHVINNLHSDIECLSSDLFKCCGDKSKIPTLKNNVEKVTGQKVDEYMFRDFTEGKVISDDVRKYVYYNSSLKDKVIPKASIPTEP